MTIISNTSQSSPPVPLYWAPGWNASGLPHEAALTKLRSVSSGWDNIWEINVVIISTSASVLIRSIITSLIFQRRTGRGNYATVYRFLVDWVLLVLPFFFSATLFTEYSLLFVIYLYILSALIIFVNSTKSQSSGGTSLVAVERGKVAEKEETERRKWKGRREKKTEMGYSVYLGAPELPLQNVADDGENATKHEKVLKMEQEQNGGQAGGKRFQSAKISSNWSRCTKVFLSVKDRLTEMRVDAGHRPFITMFRAYVNIATAVCILAIDFRVFPTRFGKKKTYGTGLMDVGVGLFIVANGIVSYEARDRTNHFSFRSGLRSAVRSNFSTIPLLLLGLARTISLVYYKRPYSLYEYGVHWNFFFTLAAVRILSSVVLCFVPPSASWFLFLLLAGGYQSSLSLPPLSLRDYILFGPDRRGSRQGGLLSANREGLLSCIGCLAIYFAGVQIGRYVLQKRVSVFEWMKVGSVLILFSCVFWFSLHVSLQTVEPVSRRMANLSYILWIVAFSLLLLISGLVVELIHVICCRTGLLPTATPDGNSSALTVLTRIPRVHSTNNCNSNSSVNNSNINSKNSNNSNSRSKDRANIKRNFVSMPSFDTNSDIDNPDNNGNHINNTNIRSNKNIKKTCLSCIFSNSSHNNCSSQFNLLEAVNRNALLYFVLANILTGLVNLVMNARKVDLLPAYLILISYTFVLSAITAALHAYDVTLKCW